MLHLHGAAEECNRCSVSWAMRFTTSMKWAQTCFNERDVWLVPTPRFCCTMRVPHLAFGTSHLEVLQGINCEKNGFQVRTSQNREHLGLHMIFFPLYLWPASFVSCQKFVFGGSCHPLWHRLWDSLGWRTLSTRALVSIGNFRLEGLEMGFFNLAQDPNVPMLHGIISRCNMVAT